MADEPEPGRCQCCSTSIALAYHLEQQHTTWVRMEQAMAMLGPAFGHLERGDLAAAHETLRRAHNWMVGTANEAGAELVRRGYEARPVLAQRMPARQRRRVRSRLN